MPTKNRKPRVASAFLNNLQCPSNAGEVMYTLTCGRHRQRRGCSSVMAASSVSRTPAPVGGHLSLASRDLGDDLGTGTRGTDLFGTSMILPVERESYPG